MISARTKAAFRAAKARGVILGMPSRRKPIATMPTLSPKACAQSSRRSFIYRRAASAKVLNDRGIKSPTGKAWQSVTMLRLVERLKGEGRP